MVVCLSNPGLHFFRDYIFDFFFVKFEVLAASLMVVAVCNHNLLSGRFVEPVTTMLHAPLRFLEARFHRPISPSVFPKY